MPNTTTLQDVTNFINECTIKGYSIGSIVIPDSNYIAIKAELEKQKILVVPQTVHGGIRLHLNWNKGE